MMDPRLNELVPLPEGAESALGKMLSKEHSRQLKTLHQSGEITEAEFLTRSEDDDPVFKIGELLILKGYKFRINHIGRRKIILKPMRG